MSHLTWTLSANVRSEPVTSPASQLPLPFTRLNPALAPSRGGECQLASPISRMGYWLRGRLPGLFAFQRCADQGDGGWVPLLPHSSGAPLSQQRPIGSTTARTPSFGSCPGFISWTISPFCIRVSLSLQHGATAQGRIPTRRPPCLAEMTMSLCEDGKPLGFGAECRRAARGARGLASSNWARSLIYPQAAPSAAAPSDILLIREPSLWNHSNNRSFIYCRQDCFQQKFVYQNHLKWRSYHPIRNWDLRTRSTPFHMVDSMPVQRLISTIPNHVCKSSNPLIPLLWNS